MVRFVVLLVLTNNIIFTATTLLNKVCFHNTPCEFPDTPRCVVVTHLFTVLFHSSRKHTIVCKETHKVCKNYTPLCIPLDQFATHHKLMRCKCSFTGEICQSHPNTPLMKTHLYCLRTFLIYALLPIFSQG